MKKCTWCGQEYPEAADTCAVDGQPLTGGEPQPKPRVRNAESAQEVLLPFGTPRLVELGSNWCPRFIVLGQNEDVFSFSEGFSRPNWKAIAATIKRRVSPENFSEAWTDAAIQWVQQLRSDLGGGYIVRCSQEFILLSALEPEAADRLLLLAERTLDTIQAALRDTAWKGGYGKHVLLCFAEDDDYFQYVSYFHRDGVHPASGGCLIHRDYVHIAIIYKARASFVPVLTHELVHNSLVHLRLPLWLNEGLALFFDRTAGDSRGAILDHELRDRHLAFWNSENIQKFWSGVSFGEPGDPNELSYSLAEILVNLLLGYPDGFAEFVKYADRDDAGQTAAMDILGTDLGQTAATFLGEGSWRPNRKAMVECWTAAK